MTTKRIKHRPYCRYHTGDERYCIRFYNAYSVSAPPGKRVKRFVFKGFEVTILKVSTYGLPYEYELRPYRDNVRYLFARHRRDVFYDVTSHRSINAYWGASYAAMVRINEFLSPMWSWLQYRKDMFNVNAI